MPRLRPPVVRETLSSLWRFCGSPVSENCRCDEKSNLTIDHNRIVFLWLPRMGRRSLQATRESPSLRFTRARSRGYFDRERIFIERIMSVHHARGRRGSRLGATASAQPTCGCRPSRSLLPQGGFNPHVFFGHFRRKSFLERRFWPPGDCALQFLRCAPATHGSVLSAR